MIFSIHQINKSALPWLRAIAAIILALGPAAAVGQTYPSKPIRIIVPYDAGGVIDLTARLLANRLSPELGQLIVEDRSGAAGKIGTESVSRAEPDGYSILYTSGPDLAVWQASPNSPTLVRNLTPISSAVSTVPAIAVRANLPIDTIGELIEFIRQNPGKLSYGTLGVGSYQHLVGEYLKQQGIVMLAVPYKGLNPVMTDLVAGQIDVAITNLTAGLPLANEGKIKILALTRSDRFEPAPNIPVVRESLPSFKVPDAWYGVFGPPDMPRPIVSRLASEIGKVLVTPEVKSTLIKLSMVAVAGTPEQFSGLIQETNAAFQTFIAAGNIKLD
jgi:tripartite-type tricarboxylate transporter receptor subunit TctC